MTDTSRLAMPGDPDLDLDLTDVTVGVVSRAGDGFVVTFTGGRGQWLGEDGAWCTGLRDCEGDMVFGLPTATPPVLAAFERLLTHWAAAGTRLRFTMAPGRAGLLWEPGGDTLPVPRSDRESWGAPTS